MDRNKEAQLTQEVGKEIAETMQSEFASGELVVETVNDFEQRFYELLDENPKTPDKMFLYFKLDVRNVTLQALQAMAGR